MGIAQRTELWSISAAVSFPVFSAPLQWVMTSPNIMLKLCEVLKKANPATIYRTHFLDLYSLPDTILRFTHGSKIGKRTSFEISIGNIFTYRHRILISILTAEP